MSQYGQTPQYYPPPPGGQPHGQPQYHPAGSPQVPVGSHPGQQPQYGAPPGQQPQYGAPPQQPQHPQQPPQQGYGQPQYAPAPAQPPRPQAAPQGQQLQQAPQNDVGAFQGGTYSITHRDTNAILTIDLQHGASIRAKPGVMIHMAATVQISGEIKFSMKKMFTGGSMAESTFGGHGKVALAPTMFGDIVTLHLDGRTKWKIGRDAFVACTQGVTKETKSQGFSKTMFSGESLFIYHVNGQGLLWLTSFGAVERLDLQPGEQHIVDNGHLVAWSCDYSIEKAGGGSMTSLKTGEGLVCRFTGPGSVYIQTRNLEEFESFIRTVAGPRQSSGGGGASLLGALAS